MDLLAYNPSQDVLAGLRRVFELEGQRIKQVRRKQHPCLSLILLILILLILILFSHPSISHPSYFILPFLSPFPPVLARTPTH